MRALRSETKKLKLLLNDQDIREEEYFQDDYILSFKEINSQSSNGVHEGQAIRFS